MPRKAQRRQFRPKSYWKCKKKKNQDEDNAVEVHPVAICHDHNYASLVTIDPGASSASEPVTQLEQKGPVSVSENVADGPTEISILSAPPDLNKNSACPAPMLSSSTECIEEFELQGSTSENVDDPLTEISITSVPHNLDENSAFPASMSPTVIEPYTQLIPESSMSESVAETLSEITITSVPSVQNSARPAVMFPSTTESVMKPELEGPPLSDNVAAAFTAISKALPKPWSVCQAEHGFRVNLFSSVKGHVVQRTIFCGFDGEVQVVVHGQELESTHSVYKNLGSVKFGSHVQDFVTHVLKCVSEVRLFEICVGAHMPKYKVFWKNSLSSCNIDLNTFHEVRYTETLRHKSCVLLVPQRYKHCGPCGKVLIKFASRKLSSPSSAKRTPNKHKPYKHCTSAEKEARSKRVAKKVLNLQRQVSRLKEKLRILIDQKGVHVDEELGDDLSDTLQEECKKIHTKKDKTRDDEFFELFMQQQIQARNVKGKRGMRWHPLMIRFALQLKMCSNQALSSARNFMHLPCNRTLFDYSHIYDVKEGCQTQFINETAETIKDKKVYQKYHVLMFDEVFLSEKIVQKKESGEVIGYCNLNEVQLELLELKKKLEEEAQSLKPTPVQTPPVTKKMLTFMIKGTANSVLTTVAAYSINNLTREDLHQYVWEVTGDLELSGIRVIAFVCDGSPINRSFFQMQPPLSKDSHLVYDTINPFHPNRPIFFMADPPHAVKTARNALENSGKKGCRLMTKNGETLTWDPIEKLYLWKAEQTIKKLPKLTAECVYLNSYSRMRVSYAARVLSQSVSDALQMLDWPNTKELRVFSNT